MPRSLPKILDNSLIDQIAGKDAENYLVLEEHPDFPGRWIVQSLQPGFIFDFEDIVGPYRTLTPNALEGFLERADSLNYEVAFGENPTAILNAYEALNDEPPIDLHSPLPNTTKGFLPYQVQGFNFLKDLDAGVAMWSTGTGKTVLASALLKYHLDISSFDIAFVIVKSHNKVNTQRTLRRLADIDSVVVDGPKKRRNEILARLLEAPPGTVVITNYEKFRVDHAELLPLFEQRILVIWDEMPTKLKSRNTRLYKSIRSLMYQKVNLTGKRPKSLRQYMLSATPIENNPEDWFNCVRLLDPDIYGSIKEFRDNYVATYSYFSNQPETWHSLDKMGLKAAHITHQVDKESPDIAAQFPKVIDEPYYIDWERGHRAVYSLLAQKATEEIDLFSNDSVLATIAVMQMLCDAPSMVSRSAAHREAYENAWEAFSMESSANTGIPRGKGSEVARKLQKFLTRDLTDEGHTKLDTLRTLLTEEHPKEKIVIFSAFNDALMPILEDHLTEWNVPYVRYDGTDKQKQTAQDYFQNEKFVRVFLSSDKGSDSLSLEQASVVIHYDLPWKWSTMIQRQNRIHRVVSNFDAVRYYTLMMENSVEERKLEIIQRKHAYHEQTFKGVSDQAESAQMTHDDLLYILRGS